MALRDHMLWDVAAFGVAASTSHELFQNREGSDAANPKHKTNMRGAGSLPDNESFVIRRVHIYPDNELAEADLPLWLDSSFITINIADRDVFDCPVRNCASHASFGGIVTQAVAGDRALVGPSGDGYLLVNPIIIEGGRSLRVTVFQGTALSAAEDIRVVLEGTLDQP